MRSHWTRICARGFSTSQSSSKPISNVTLRSAVILGATGAVAWMGYDFITHRNYELLKSALLKWDPLWDENGIEEATAADDIGRREILFIRHGQYHMDSETLNLTDLGKEQAKVTGQRLKNIVDKVQPDQIRLIHSSMTRAQETASIINEILEVPKEKIYESPQLAEGIPITPDPQIQDCKSNAEDSSRIEEAYQRFVRTPGGKDQNKVRLDIIVCHANVIRFMLCRGLQLNPQAWLRFSVGHCGITQLSLDNEGFAWCTRVGDNGHLPLKLVSY